MKAWKTQASCSTGTTPPLHLSTGSTEDGLFEFPMPYLTVPTSPLRREDNDPLNGVSTYDLSLITKHILGLAPFSSPYKLIAADVNNSRSVTTLDVIQLRANRPLASTQTSPNSSGDSWISLCVSQSVQPLSGKSSLKRGSWPI